MSPADPSGDASEGADVAALAARLVAAEAEIVALRNRESRLRSLVDGLPMLIWSANPEGQVTFTNRRYDQLFGQPATEMLGEGWKQVVLPEDLERFQEVRLKAFQNRQPFRAEVRVRDSAGQIHRLRCDEVPRGNAAGMLCGIVGCAVDITNLKETEEALRKEREHLAAIIGQCAVGIGQGDREGKLVCANDAFCAILGRSREDVLGRRVQDFTHPEDVPATEAHYTRLFENAEPYVLEKRYLRPDGSTVWVRAHVSPVRDAAGQPCLAVSVIEDISERIAAEQRHALLVRELDHRAKNALAVVQAAVKLTRADDVCTFAKAVEGRVAALARAHTLLAAGHWLGADLPVLFKEELAAFLNNNPCEGPRVELDGAPVTLAPTAAQALSMLVHELATNATKHGALSVPNGHVSVSWRLDRTAGKLRMKWEESGGPPIADEPARRGFGTRVIETTVRNQLGGTLSRTWVATGLVCEIEVPLTRAVAS
jgi:PAS domain S-box-containing protein